MRHRDGEQNYKERTHGFFDSMFGLQPDILLIRAGSTSVVL
jgi:hypothetical protein